ncbi:very long chain fatty acid elongase 4-like [Zophobas morio]|uniref:very long chain fatty acid elongase 4-like n=1 Tax=Zophobas morio TaxID=2755281 RepID=UPI003082BD69
MGIAEICQFTLLQTPLHPLILIVSYLLFVLKLGPIWMKNRQQFEMKKVLMLYNTSQIFFNASLFVELVPLLFKLNLFCGPIEKSELTMYSTLMVLCYKYILLKVYDMVETGFFVLRKSHRQITFLHVYHHVVIFGTSWICAKYFLESRKYPLGPILVFGVWNTFVHSLMYTYYLLSINGSLRQLWWKKCITLLQLAQHSTMLVTTAVDAINDKCPYPMHMQLVGLINFSLMVYLFSRFYLEAYCAKNKNFDRIGASGMLLTLPRNHSE